MSGHQLLDTGLLKRARLAAGYTERGLARRLGTSALRIRRIEGGVAHDTITLAMLIDLAAALRLQPAELLNPPGDGPPHPPCPQQRPLSLQEARLLHRALHGKIPMIARGPAGAATAHLIATGVFTATRADPTGATTITAAPEVHDALSPLPPTPAAGDP